MTHASPKNTADGKRILGIIPARGHSRRIRRKNVRVLAGKPLIAHTIDAANNSRHVNRVLVSSDDAEILEIARAIGAEAFLQPKRLSGPTASINDVVAHVIKALGRDGYKPDVVALIQPTSPLRTGADIDGAISLFLKNQARPVVSVTPASPAFRWLLSIEEGRMSPFFAWDHFTGKGAPLPNAYIPNGAVYVSTPALFLQKNSFYGLETGAYPMPRGRSIDIDEEIDFMVAEQLMKKMHQVKRNEKK